MTDFSDETNGEFDTSKSELQLYIERWFDAASEYWLTRFVLLRGIGFIYAVAFSIAVCQLKPLIGSDGLLPAQAFLERLGSAGVGFFDLPSVFWFIRSDSAMLVVAWLGLLLSLLVMAGWANSIILTALWGSYLSIVHVGQVFWGYGWEALLCEAGFLAIFLAPGWSLKPFPKASPPPAPVIVLFRWLAFRVMFGAGLIKIRGDPCWLDLSCLVYHYETQPIPNPLSLYLHHMPRWFHEIGVLFNHLVELIAPFGVFGPRRVRWVSGALIVAFQVILILSGNLSFLNWLTLVVALSCFDDRLFERALTARFRTRVRSAVQGARSSFARRISVGVLVLSVAALSLNPVVNMLSSRQAMNASFDPWLLVNTYGAFGSVSKVRHEVVLEGTDDARPHAGSTFRAYEFPCKPGDPRRRPCFVTPYHYRLDWQMWFAALSSYREQPWILHLMYKLLQGDPTTLSLFAKNPFVEHPPRWLRARLYRYRFANPGADVYYYREPVGDYVRPVSLDDSEFLGLLQYYGWVR